MPESKNELFLNQKWIFFWAENFSIVDIDINASSSNFVNYQKEKPELGTLEYSGYRDQCLILSFS